MAKQVADIPGTSVAVGTASTLVLEANEQRDEVIVVNDSDTIIYLRLAATGAVVREGIRLNAEGGSWVSTSWEGPVSAIHGGLGTKPLCVVEV